MGESAAEPEPEPDAAPGWEIRAAFAVPELPRTGWGHRGYEEQAVDDFVGVVRRECAAATEQIEDLRQEIDRLHRYVRRQWAAVAAAESAVIGPDGETQRITSPAAQARAVLTQAQEIAERRIEEARNRVAEAARAAESLRSQAERLVTDRLTETDRLAALRLREADAEAALRLDRADTLADDVLTQARRAAVQKRTRAQDDVRRLLALGRRRYEEIVVRAHHRAGEAAELALQDFENAAYQTTDSGRARAELDMKAAYLRTFATVSRAALQAALEVTGREFDRVLGPEAPIA